MVFGYKIYAGYAPVLWKDLLAKLIMTVAVFGTLSWGGLAQVVYNAFVSFMEGAAATIMAGKPTAQMLDALWSNVRQRIRDASQVELLSVRDDSATASFYSS